VGAIKWLNTHEVPKLDVQAQMFLRMVLEQVGLLQTQRKELDKQITERAKSYAQAEILDSIPGLGFLGILALLSSIAGVERFKRPDQLSSYFGACGRVFQSGGTLVLVRMTRRGNVHVTFLFLRTGGSVLKCLGVILILLKNGRNFRGCGASAIFRRRIQNSKVIATVLSIISATAMLKETCTHSVVCG
jgi:hypothetical protein